MANSRFVVINAAHDNGRGESVLLVSSLSLLIVLLVVAAIFVAIHTDGRSKVSFHFQSCLLAITALNRSFISLVEPDSFYYARLFLNSVLRIDCSI